MRNKIIQFFALASLIIVFNSCKKEYESIQTIDDAKIQAYIKQNNLSVVKDPTGFYYQILDAGTGDVLLNKDSVFYTVIIKSLTGTVYSETAKYNNAGTYLGYVTPDPFRIAMANVKRGGKVRLLIPSYLAYGKNGSGNVPSNEVLDCVITTLKEKSQIALDDNRIKAFLLEKNLVAQPSSTRVWYIVTQQGTGLPVDIASTIKVKYTGRLLNGTIFDQTTGDATAEFRMNDPTLIQGWRKILVAFSKGTKVRIFVPSDLAYGLRGRLQAGISESSILDFDIEIVDVTN